MTTFTFQVDRAHAVIKPIQLFPNVELSGSSFEVPVGQQVVYRGLIELGGVPRYTFDLPERKGYTSDRQQLVEGLVENFDELVKI